MGPGQLLRVEIEIYGLVSGPNWLRASLTVDLLAAGYVKNPYDKCLFTLFSSDESSEGQLLLDVDDFIEGGNEMHRETMRKFYDVRNCRVFVVSLGLCFGVVFPETFMSTITFGSSIAVWFMKKVSSFIAQCEVLLTYDKYRCGKAVDLMSAGQEGTRFAGRRAVQNPDFCITVSMDEYVKS